MFSPLEKESTPGGTQGNHRQAARDRSWKRRFDAREIFFNPQQMSQTNNATPGQSMRTINNNVAISWNTDSGYHAVLGLLAELAERRVEVKQAA